MTTFIEGKHRGEFLHSEANRTQSRDAVTVASSVSLVAGTVMGKITASGKWKILAPAASDGTQNAAGVLYDNVDASAGDVVGAAMITRAAEVNGAEITWPAGISGPQTVTATAQLAALGILVR